MNFTEALIIWYKKNKRDLPWRNTRDPYRIWLSEIILQQTRIKQGQDYYLAFVNQFPDLPSLAGASEEEILKLWQGLGYYTRARNLYKTAQIILTDYNGQFPENYNDLLKLSGIGSYSAAAIASLAFGQPYPVVDGNVLRFLSRYFGLKGSVKAGSTKKEIFRRALNLIDHENPGEFNQAVMEFGSLYCKPKNPDCKSCVFKTDCRAFQGGLVNYIPVKPAKSQINNRYFHYLIFADGKGVYYLKKRTGNDIWKNMYDFPLIEKKSFLPSRNLLLEIAVILGTNAWSMKQLKQYDFRHILTHQVIHARLYQINFCEPGVLNRLKSGFGNDILEVKYDAIHRYPVPRPIEKFLKKFLVNVIK